MASNEFGNTVRSAYLVFKIACIYNHDMLDMTIIKS
jgi:hypothetical protein